MGKSKQRTVTTIIAMTIIAVIIVIFYFNWSNKMDNYQDTSAKGLSEADKLINLDLKQNYPETTEAVVKLYCNMIKVVHSGIKDDQVKALAIKMRELFDTELIQNNPEDSYLQKLYSDVASSKDKGRVITNYLIDKENIDQQNTVDGKDYATVYVSFTIMEKSKFSENWRYLLRKDDQGLWKIMGWEFAQNNEAK